jgi:hypothetical protein
MSDIKNFERNKYFYGKLMTVRDFETEQSYFIEKQRLINRLIHGAGVVCGLKVEEAEEDTTKIKINPGVAIDCCGRDIIVPEEKVVDLKDSLEGADMLYVLLKYDFCEKESVPVINNVSACEETCCYNRILETYKIEISDTKPDDCTLADKKLCEVWLDAKHPEEFVDYWIEKGCQECPQEPAVLLAAITLLNSTIKEIDNAIKDDDDDEGIKKSLVFSNAHLYELIKCVEKQPGPKGEDGEDGLKGDTGDRGPGLEEKLTVIDKITPTFEDEVILSKILENGITIKFSNEITSATVDNDTFQVAVFAPLKRGNILMHHYEYIEGEISTDDDENGFTFRPLNSDTLERLISEYQKLEGGEGKLKILVQIKCDFIKDKENKAVAGHHLRENNSGLNIEGKYNIQGGIFESWFTLK